MNDTPQHLSRIPEIIILGVGGAGGNAINNMIASGIKDVTFAVINTDTQALEQSKSDNIIHIGKTVTEGLGAGARPEIGKAAASESYDDIRELIKSARMLFITAGMGGGTGSGAAPVVAQIAREEGILTVGVVTKPFDFEGKRRQNVATEAIVELRNFTDTLIVIPNQNLFRVSNANTTFREAFLLADDVLRSGVECITDLVVKEGLINLDFADVRTVMADMGIAVMGTGQASGEDRAVSAARSAINNPILDNVDLSRAQAIIVSITGSENMTLFDVEQASSEIQNAASDEANIIIGASFSDDIGEDIKVSVVATGIDDSENDAPRDTSKSPLPTSAAPADRRQDQAMSIFSATPGYRDFDPPKFDSTKRDPTKFDQNKSDHAAAKPPEPNFAASDIRPGRQALDPSRDSLTPSEKRATTVPRLRARDERDISLDIDLTGDDEVGTPAFDVNSNHNRKTSTDSKDENVNIPAFLRRKN